MEEYAYILDSIPAGAGFGPKSRGPICYAVGDDEFKLFELVPKANAQIMIDDRVYIGKDPNLRTQIDHVKRRIGYEDLSSTAAGELKFIIEEIVKEKQDRFIVFYNKAEAISSRKHLLEELPGLGKITAKDIVDARKTGEFKDFEDLKARTSMKDDPAKLIAERILLEISDSNRRHYLFVVR